MLKNCPTFHIFKMKLIDPSVYISSHPNKYNSLILNVNVAHTNQLSTVEHVTQYSINIFL